MLNSHEVAGRAIVPGKGKGTVDKPEPRPTGNQWDVYAEQIRKQLPAAPEELLAGYMRWAPWVYIVLGAIAIVFLVLGGLILTGVSLLVMAGGGSGVSSGLGGLIAVVVGIVVGVLGVVGGLLMRQQRLTGWWIIAVGIVLQLISNLFSVAILGLLITLAVAYVHLLVKPRYV
jgi:hypothetical protein